MLNKSERFYVIFFGAVFVLVWTFFSLVDFEFSESVYKSSVAIDWVVRLSMVPSFVIGWVFGLRLTAYAFRGNIMKDKNTTPVPHMLLGILVTLFFPIYLFWSILRLSNMVDDSNSWVMMIVLIILSVAAGLRLTNNQKDDIVRSSSRALTGLLILLANLLLSVIIAFLWQRDTYYSILNEEAAVGFTAWYAPNFNRLKVMMETGNFSFGSYPSFIATNAFSLSIAVYLQDKHNRVFRNFLVVLSVLYGIVISAFLVVSGKAYVTDCLASMLISFVSLFVGGSIFRKKFPSEPILDK